MADGLMNFMADGLMNFMADGLMNFMERLDGPVRGNAFPGNACCSCIAIGGVGETPVLL
jgi:hypothetical protein